MNRHVKKMESFLKRTLIVPDYDGTLTGSNGVVSGQNRAVLDVLGKQNHVRGIAIKRNLCSIGKVIESMLSERPIRLISVIEK
ncbi:MAG: hypothetical protein FJ112_02830 [Deltaproteobacteria bacterium]|nr:hypothetical protein [Deltaproteobacteria bacterium]